MTFYNNLKFLFLAPLIIFLFVSCEDEVSIETDALQEQLVVDAWLTNQSESQVINLSRSQPYFENTLQTGVTGANVVVTSSEGIIYEFLEEASGNYVWTPSTGESIGTIGTQYTLQITLDEAIYEATSFLNRVPPVDSITYEFRDDEPFGPDGIYTEFFARDPIGGGDTYWIKTFKNGAFLNKPEEINIAFDAGFSEGGALDGLIFIPPIREATNRVPDPDTEDDNDVSPWAVDDEIRVEIHSLNIDAFYFLSSAQGQITNGNNGIFAEPVINTTGNIIGPNSEEVLGMFNVAAVSELTTIIE